MAYNFEKLPKRLKTKWVKALRSGEYNQGETDLYNTKEDSYCCLGVLGRCVGIPVERLDNGTGIFGKEDMEVPKPFIGDVDENPLVDKLTDLNDISRKSFKYIANWIEKYL